MKRWLLRLLLVVGATAVLLAAAEAVLSAADLLPDPAAFSMPPMTTSLEQDSAGRFERHATRWFSTAAGFHDSSAHLGREATAEWPFRGRPGAPLPPAVSLPRVLVVGDSCVYGFGLDACDTLGWKLQQALEERGLPPERVAVIPLGVPGYSTEQLLPLLREALATYQPVAVVLYPAAWNDQAPAVLAPDRELLGELAHPGPLDWLRHHSRIGAALLPAREPLPQEELLASWNEERPARGWRVPAADVGTNVAAMLAACASAGARAVVIAPPQPEGTRRDHPRTEQDSLQVLAVATAAGVPCVDGQAALRAAGGDSARWFTDYVHPSADAVAVLVAAIAEPVRSAVQHDRDRRAADSLASCSAAAIEVLDVQPREAFALGDVKLTLRLDGWNRRLPPPAVLVGGAPLVGVHAVDMQVIEGTLSANGAGLHDVLVQGADGVGRMRGAVRLLDPRVELQPGTPTWLAVTARPDDRVRLVFATKRRDEPQWTPRGALWLADPQPLNQELIMDGLGHARLQLPERPAQRVYVQGLWAPAAQDTGTSPQARWMGVVELGG